ncbi:CBO0543 family protein [Paenibacillus sp. S-38]|uniref:CBO0543 family protein n=1 Tax=Paenibacillus sp. S-38 TaxID=3416710 RepID=UPI003CF12C00
MEIALLAVPLLALFLYIDRGKAFLLGFYGFCVHMLFTYIDVYGIMHGLWIYPYKAVPFLSVNLPLDTSLIPVLYLFMYQWTINFGKNYYIYGTALCLFLSFLFKPAMVAFDLFRFNHGTGCLHLFAGYLTILCLSRWVTNLFLYAERISKQDPPDGGPVKPLPRALKLTRLFPRPKAR